MAVLNQYNHHASYVSSAQLFAKCALHRHDSTARQFDRSKKCTRERTRADVYRLPTRMRMGIYWIYVATQPRWQPVSLFRNLRTTPHIICTWFTGVDIPSRFTVFSNLCSGNWTDGCFDVSSEYKYTTHTALRKFPLPPYNLVSLPHTRASSARLASSLDNSSSRDLNHLSRVNTPKDQPRWFPTRSSSSYSFSSLPLSVSDTHPGVNATLPSLGSYLLSPLLIVMATSLDPINDHCPTQQIVLPSQIRPL